MKGYGGKILNVDLSSGNVTLEQVTEEMARDYIGGSGFAVKLLIERSVPNGDAFDPSNPLIMAPGLFNGFPVPTGGKVVFCTKSPLTGLMGDSVMGGSIGGELKHAGFDALVITGRAANPCYLLIKDDQVEIRDADDLWGLDVPSTATKIKNMEGNVRVACIGPAGENLVRFAGIDCEDRQAGRAGTGAVMGSKNLKAIVIRGTRDLVPHDPTAMMQLNLEMVGKMTESPDYEADTKYGTGEFLDWINSEKGTFPTRNWRESVFEERKEIDPYYWAPKYSKKNKACFSCSKPCGKLFIIESGKYAGLAIDGVEYETLYSLGGACGNGDIESVAKGNEICDAMGMDTISAGDVVAFAMDLYENGIISEEDTGGLELGFGNSEAELALLEMMAKREGLGDTLAEGVRLAAEKIGKGSEKYAVHVKGMEPPAYDVRGIKGMALAFMTSTRGACHLRTCAYALELTGKFWKFKDVDRFSYEGKGTEIKDMEDLVVVYDALGVCKFSRGYFFASGFIDLIKATTGSNYSEEDILQVGERINNLKQLFVLREGMTREDYVLPEKVTTMPIPKGESDGHMITIEGMNKMLGDYFDARGWDENATPTREKLEELGL
ncbi:MAG: aldehyde ferredoxin oxidoreductase family protein [Methanobacteriota archaeon]|nr:MAG: aldehyde ferredoxin oxidoreductase family protein [Euryarchaeota archaeon]